MILDSSQSADDAVLSTLVPLNAMFGYSTVLRSNTQVGGRAGGRVGGGWVCVRHIWLQLGAAQQHAGGWAGGRAGGRPVRRAGRGAGVGQGTR
jgi:hypothetical protein